MGAITRAAANNITSSGVILPAGINDASVASISALSQVSSGDGITLISSQTGSGASQINFTTGIDSTYRTYMFKFINIKVSTDAADFGFLTSINGGSSYGVTTTNTTFRAFHYENDANAGVGYVDSFHLAQSTGLNKLSLNQGNNSDDSYSGTLHLFSPSSTTYVKHFISCNSNSHDTTTPLIVNNYLAGYVNSTSAVNAIQFKADSGTFDGTIYMYGIA